VKNSIRSLTLTVILVISTQPGKTQELDWSKIEAKAIRLLQDYIRIDTSNPPGDVRRSADLLEGVLKAAGIPLVRYESAPGKSILLARLKGTGSGKPILLMHHMDVVPADPARWKIPPFSGELREGEVWGRGAMDMKGIGVAHLEAFLALKQSRVPMSRDVLFMAVPDEEVGGGLGARWMLSNHYAELEPEYVLDEGGFGSRDLFAPGKLVFGISVAEKKIVWMKIRAEGVAGHGSQPHAQNPNDRLVRGLARLLAEPLPGARLAVLDALKAKVGVLAENKFTNAIQHSTLSLTTLHAGVGDPPKVNVIPSVAEATLDCRLLPGVTTLQWLEEIRRRLADPGLKIEVTYESDDPVVTPQDTPFYRALESAVLRHHPGAIVSPILIPYGTDSNAFRPRGVNSYGFVPAVLSAEIVASMHGDAERVPAGELGKAIRILFEALRETAMK